MTIVQSVILALIQGVAEFLPISSSGHLIVVQRLFGLSEVPLLFDIMLHLATLFAIVLYFRKKIFLLLCVLFRTVRRLPQVETDNEDDILSGTDERGRRTILAVILTTLITGILGIFVRKFILNGTLAWSIEKFIVAGGFFVTAILLVTSSIFERSVTLTNTRHISATKPALYATLDSTGGEGILWYKALFIGFMQGLGTLPGLSRSGATISGSLFCGVEREVAGVYSFLVSIPAILGAFVLDVRNISKVIDAVPPICVIIGCLTAFVSGYLSLTLLMRVIKRGKLQLFAPYLVLISIGVAIFL